MVGFAIVGCGMIARFHARALADVAGAQLVALVSRSSERAAAMASELRLDCDLATDLKAVLARPDVHAVIITTPSGAASRTCHRGRQGRQACGRRKTARNHGRTLRSHHRGLRAAWRQAVYDLPVALWRCEPALKAAVEAGRFGRLTLGETTCKWWRPQSYYDEGGWKGTQALDGGGALMNQAIHNVDLLLWLMGAGDAGISGFTATLAHERIEVEDTAVACLRFANGALGVIQATTSVHPGLAKTIGIHGDNGTVVIEQDDVLRWDFHA